jgi:hypothetical protein
MKNFNRGGKLKKIKIKIKIKIVRWIYTKVILFKVYEYNYKSDERSGW